MTDPYAGDNAIGLNARGVRHQPLPGDALPPLHDELTRRAMAGETAPECATARAAMALIEQVVALMPAAEDYAALQTQIDALTAKQGGAT